MKPCSRPTCSCLAGASCLAVPAADWPLIGSVLCRVCTDGLWSKRQQTRTALSLSWNKQNYAEYLLKKDVKRDKLLVVLIVVTLLCLIVRFFRLRLCKMNDTILHFQYVRFRCISYFSGFSSHNTVLVLVDLLKFYPVKINVQLRWKQTVMTGLISFTEYRPKHCWLSPFWLVAILTIPRTDLGKSWN